MPRPGGFVLFCLGTWLHRGVGGPSHKGGWWGHVAALGGHSHSCRGCPGRGVRQPRCANCSGPHVASCGGVRSMGGRHSGNMWWAAKNLMPLQ